MVAIFYVCPATVITRTCIVAITDVILYLFKVGKCVALGGALRFEDFN